MQCFMGGTVAVLDAPPALPVFRSLGCGIFLGLFLLLSTLSCLSVNALLPDSLLPDKSRPHGLCMIREGTPV